MLQSIVQLLPPRKADSHKGDYGHIFVLAGSAGMTGAAVLTSQAGLLCGSGLVTLGIPKSLNIVAEIKLTEVMSLPLPETAYGSFSLKARKPIIGFCKKKADVVAIGPGISRNKETQRLILNIIPHIEQNIVLDADGINALVGRLNLLKKVKRTLVITPHLGEMGALLGKKAEEIKSCREDAAKEFACRHRVVVVLKGYRSIVAAPTGEIYINETGNPGMATAGSGDVLTGMIAAFIGQNIEPFSAAKLAVHLHGLAGDLARDEKTEISLTSADILDKIPEAIRNTIYERRDKLA